ncbi:hypothetical protein D3C86_934310 [compost metagenome]
MALRVLRQIQGLGERRGGRPDGPDQGAGRDDRPVRKPHLGGGAGGHRVLEVKLDATLAQAIGRVVPQRGADLGEDARRELDQDQPDLAGVEPWVVAADPFDVGLDLAQALDPGRAAADHHEGQEGPALGGILRELRRLERVDDLVVKGDRVLGRLEGEGHLAHPGEGGEVRLHPAREHQMVEGQALLHAVSVGEDLAALLVEAANLGLHHPDSLEEGPEGHHHVPGLDPARDHLGQQRIVEKVVGAVDQGDVEVVPPAHGLLQGEGRVDPPEAPPDDDDALHGAASLSRVFPEAGCVSRAVYKTSAPRQTHDHWANARERGIMSRLAGQL